MFSNNGKISEKQLQKMVLSSVFAGTIFVIPYLSARLFKEDILLGLLLFLVFGSLYLFFFYGVGEHYEIGNNKWFLSLRVARLIIRLAVYIVLAVAVLGEAEVPFMQGKETDKLSNLLVILPLLFVAVYGANRNIEKQGRIREMIFWTLFVPFVVMLLFGLGEVDYSVFIPKLSMPLGSLTLFGYSLLAFLLPAENYLYARTFVRKKSGEKLLRSLILVLLLVVVLSLFLIGIYGVYGAGQEEMVTIAIMRYIRLPLGVLERFDVLIVWFFMTGCFVLVCETLYYAGYLLSLIFDGVKRVWLLYLILIMSLLIVWFLPDYKETIFAFMRYGAVMDVPISIILPIVEMVAVEKKRRG